MKPRDLIDLLLLAAIWGASFLFMRMAVPAFGAAPLAFVRVGGAALLLLPLLLARGEAGVLRQRWPTLLLLGEEDRMTPAARARPLAAAIAGARTTVLPGCGHMIMVERPDETLAALADIF